MHQQRRERPGALRAGLLRIDPVGPLLALVGAAVFLLQGFGGVLSRDLGLYAYAGQQFAEGVPPYVGVMNRAGPLAHMVPGFGVMAARTLGTDDLLTMRVLMMLLTLVAVWLTYLLGRDLFDSRWAGVVAAVSLIAFRAVVIYATGGPREKTTMMLLVICVLLAARHRRWAWAGAATALATLTWQPAFWLCVAAVLATAVELPVLGRWRSTLRHWVGFGLGGVLATGVVVGYFVAAGALDAFVEGFLYVNATSTRQVGLVEFLELLPGEMLDAFGWSLWLVLAGLVASVPLAWRARRSTDAAARARVGVGAATVVSAAWSVMVFNGWADAVFVLPLAAVGLAGAVIGLAARLPSRPALAVTVAYAVVVPVAAGVTAYVNRPDDLAPMRAETEAMLEAAGADVGVLSVGAPQPLVVGQLTNPLRHQMFIGGLQEYLDETWPGGLEAMAAVVQRDRPRYITMDHPTWYKWLQPVLDDDYQEIGTTQGFTWYVERSVGEEEMVRLQRILASGP